MSQLIKKKFPSITSIDVGTDGNTSFLRAARNGQLEKVLEHLDSNIDINTSNANGLNALHLASKDGHVKIVEELLKRGAVIDAATKKGNTALHIASLAGQEEVVKLLVTHGASVNVQSQNGFTPLYMAAQENHDNVVKYLLANGANQSLSTEDGFTPLAVAMQQGHDKVVTVLLENDTRGKVRLPALHIAAKKDDVKAAKLLLENEHNPDVTSKSGFTPLHIASHYGNQSIANLLVQKGADVNYAAKHNITPLHVAAKWGKTNMVSVLLEQGANIESKTRDGLTPLHCAARSGHEQVVNMLLEKGAPISSKTKNGLAPLHMAAQGDHVDAARILLYHRAPVDEVTVDYLTALHVAAHCGHVRVAKLLLDRQADANARALNGFTPLHIACKKNRIKVVELLLRNRASIGATTESGLTPLHVASFMGCMNIVIYLLQHDASPDVPTVRGETPLHLAARANQTDIIRILLRNGAQVDARAREQQTPLHIASRLGNVDIVMLLLQHGAKVDNTTKDMYTALHIAAKEGQDEVAAALIDNGASLNATTKKGFTPLHLASKYGHLKVAKLLLQKEAPVDAQGKNGVTPLHVASHYDHQNVALLLLEKGASPYATAKNGHTPLHIAAKKNQMDIANTLLEYGAKPNAESKAGFTPLHLSAQEGHCDMTDLLIEHKADPNHTAKNGLTPLHLCAQEDKVPVAEILVKNGGEVDAATKNGYTPLHIACHYGQMNMVRFLLQHNANVKATTSLGYTPLHQAAQQGHTNIVNTLLENSAQPNAVTNTGQTPLHIAEKLGYITVIDTLKVVTEPASPMTSSTISNEEKYRVVAPEAMHETFMSDSEEEGGEDTVLGDQTYRYLTADEMKSLGDDSLPIDVTRDERIDSNKIAANNENMLPPRNIEDNISPEHVQQNYVEYIKKYTPDNIDIDKHPINIGFLVSFLVDARGGAMRGCRHSGVRVIVPPRCASSPTRITCRYVRPQRTPHPPPLMEGEALASRVLELGPVGAKFLGPVIIEVPHFAALRGKEREIVILRSDNGESWKEHTVEATEDVLNEVLHDSFEAEDLNQLEDLSSGRITRIVTQDFPQYFAVVSRIRQEVHAIGPDGGMVSSTVVPQVQAVFPEGALTKKIKVGLQAQPIDPELTAKLLGHGVAVSPVVTVEPRRRKFHKAITLSMPAPRAHSQGMINQYSGTTPTLRLLCSITGGTTRAQWEDVTGSTPLTFVNDCVSFTTTVSARFWLMDCRNVSDATKMATELYREAIHVPFMAKFVVFAKRVDPLEARLRVFCMTDDKEDKTLEHQEHFTEVAKSRDVEVLEGKPQYIEFAGNLVPITKSDEQLQFSFRAFRENRLPFSVRVKDQHAEAVSRCLFMREPKLPKGEPPQQPICILNIVLPDDIVVDTISLTDSDSLKKIENFDYYRPDPRLADMSNLLGEDWVPLAAQLGLTTSEINVIKSEYPDSVAKQAQSMLRMWLSQSGNKAQTNTLESALRRIGREDIIPQCLNVDYPPHGIKEIGKQRLIKKLEENIYEKDVMRDSESVESVRKAEDERKTENFDKYSAEEKIVETSDEEDFNKTVTERRHQIEERLSVDRTVPASSQRVEIVQEITSIKRQSLVENKIAEVEQKKVGEIIDTEKTTITSNELMISPTIAKVIVDGERRDSDLLEGVTQRFEQKMIQKVVSTEDPKSPKVSKTPPPSPADFIIKEQTASIQEWDVSKKSASQEEASLPQGAEQQGLSTTTERLVASNEDTLLDKPLGQQLTGLSVTDDTFIFDLKTVCEQTNAFIQSESQPEPYDALADKYTRKEPINEKKVDDNKNNMNEKKKAKKGFFGSIKTFVERSFESDSESEKSPKKSKKPKKDKKKKPKDETTSGESSLPPRKPKLPTPPLEPIDIDTIPFAEASVNDIPPPYKPPDIPSKEQPIPVTDLDADLEVKPVQIEKTEIVTTQKEPEKLHSKDVDEKEKSKKEKPKEKEKKKIKGKTIIVEEVTKTIEPLVIEAEEFSIIVDPTKKESPKKCKETFTVNIDESIEKKEKEILEKSPILSEEKIIKPIAALEMQADTPIRPPRVKDHIYEDIESSPVSLPQDKIKEITTDLIQNEINFGAWSDVSAGPEKLEKEEESQKEIIEKQDKEILKEKESKSKTEDAESKKKEEKKGGFFGLFKKKDSRKEDEPVIEKVEKDQKPSLSEAVVTDMDDSRQFLVDEVENYHDVRTTTTTDTTVTEPVVTTTTTAKPDVEETKQESEGFFSLFKKPKKEESVDKKAKKEEKASDKKTDTLERKLKKEESVDKKSKKEEKTGVEKKADTLEKKLKKEDSVDKKSKKDEKKVAVILSQEVLRNILDSKRFLEGEVQNYNDVRPQEEPVVATEEFSTITKSAKTEIETSKETVTKKPLEEQKEPSTKHVIDEKKDESPKRTDDKKESSPKPSPGFFGLFKKSKKDETEAESKPILSEKVLEEMKNTDQFLVCEVENYHDVKPTTEETKTQIDITEAKAAGAIETQSSSFLGLFKKGKKEEETQPIKFTLPEAVEDKIDAKQILSGKGEKYDTGPITEKSSEEEKLTESAEQPSSGFFGLFKKTKKEDEKIVVDASKETVEIITETVTDVDKGIKVEEDKIKKVVEEVRESSPKPAGFFGLFKKSKKDEEETVPTKPPLSDSVVKDMDDTNQFLSTEVNKYQDVKPEKFELIQEEKVKLVEASPKPSKGVFGIFKKPKKDEEVPIPETIVSESIAKDVKKVEEQAVAETEKLTKAADEETESFSKSRGIFGIFKKGKKEQEESDEAKPLISEAVIQDMKNTNMFLMGEITNYHDVKPEKFDVVVEEKVTKIEEESAEASPKPSRSLFGIFKKSKKDQEDSVESKPTISETVQKEMSETDTFLTVEVEQYEDVKPVVEETTSKVQEEIESSIKPSKGLFGIFKKSKKSEEEDTTVKPDLSEIPVKEIETTTEFITAEVQVYDDVKPEKFEALVEEIKDVQKPAEAPPKPARGLFGIFKTSKKDKEESDEAKPALSEETVKNITDSSNFLSQEVDKYHDVKPEKFESAVEEKATKMIEETTESSPKPSRGIFGIFKSPKKDKDEPEEVKPVALSEETFKNITDSSNFLNEEVQKYHDVKPEKFEPVTEEKATKMVEQTTESSPKPSRGLFGIFKSPKKDKDEVQETKADSSDEIGKNITDSSKFSTEEVQKYHDMKPDTFETVGEEKVTKIVEETTEASPKLSRGLFGIFKSPKKDKDESGESKPTLSEETVKTITDTTKFLTDEVQNYHDVKPEKFDAIVEQKVSKTVEESVEGSPKPSRGLFGIFKSPKKDKDESIESKPHLTEEIIKTMSDTTAFLSQEIEDYHDVKPEQFETLEEEKLGKTVQELSETSKPSRGLFGLFKTSKKDKEESAEQKSTHESVKTELDTSTVLTEEVQNNKDAKSFIEEKVVKTEEPKESKESTSRPTSGIFGIFKKSKKDEIEYTEITAPVTDTVQKTAEAVKEIEVSEAVSTKENQPKVSEEKVQTILKTESEEIEPKQEVKVGFLSKFKITKKKPSLVETQLSEEVRKSIDETNSFLSTEVNNYEDEKVKVIDKDKKEEKSVTFEATKSKMVLEGHLPQPEVAQVVEVIKTDITDQFKEADEKVSEVQDVTLQEAKEIQQAVEQVDSSNKRDKDKQGKDKKGFFHRFGKKSKSQETSFEEPRERSIDEGESSPKKQKRRKSSSPFKFFEKMKKSEEEVKVKEIEETPLPKTEEEIKATSEQDKDDSLNVEFEDQPMNLSEEVLSSLEKKMEELKSKYTPEVQKQLNDCRDFLFIEVDNYDDSKAVVITDIDTGVTTDATKAVDDIIDKAAKVVEDTKKEADAATKEVVEPSVQAVTQAEEATKKATKKKEKAERKSGGFFSKLGNLISGSVDEAKSELKEARKSAEKAVITAKESVEKSLDTAAIGAQDKASKAKDKVQETQKTVSEKAADTKDKLKELQDSAVKVTQETVDEVSTIKDHVADSTAQKVEETKQELALLKESILEAKAKTGEKVSDLKKGTVEKTKTAVDGLHEIKDEAAQKLDDTKKDISDKIDESKSEVKQSVESTKEAVDKKLQGAKDAAEEVAVKVQDSVQTVVDTSAQKVSDFKKETSDVVTQQKQEFDKTKEAATEKISDAKKDTKTFLEKGKESVVGGIGKMFGTTKEKTDAIAKTKDDALEQASQEVEQIKQETQERMQKITDTATEKYEAVGMKLQIAKDTTKEAAVKVQEAVETAVDTSAQKVSDFKKETSDVVEQQKEEFDKTKQIGAEKISDVKKDTKTFLEKGKESVVGGIGKMFGTSKEKTDAIAKTKDDALEKASHKVEQIKQETQEKAQKITDKATEKYVVAVTTGDQLKADIETKATQKLEETEKIAAATTDKLKEGVESTKESVKAQVENLQDTKEKIEDTMGTTYTKATDELSKKVESVKDKTSEEIGKTKENLEDTFTGVKDSLQKAADQKVEEMKRTKDSLESAVVTKVDEIKTATSEKVSELEQAKKDVADVTLQKINNVQKTKDDAKEAILKKSSEVKDLLSQKAEDLAQAKESVKDTTQQKIEQIVAATTGKVEEKGKAVQETIIQKAEEVSKVKEDVKSAAATKAEDFAAVTSQKIDKLKQVKQDVKDSTVEKVHAASEAISGKIDDAFKAKTKLEEDLQKKSQDFVKSTSEKIDESKTKIETETLKKTEQLLEVTDDISKLKETIQEGAATQLSQLAGGTKEIVTSKAEDLSKTATKKVEEIEKTKQTVTDVTESKLDDLTKAAAKKIDDISKVKDDVKKIVGDKTEGISKTTEDIKEKVEDKISDIAKTTSEKVDDLHKAKEEIAKSLTQPSEEVSKAKESLVKESNSVAGSLTVTAGQKLDNLRDVKDGVQKTLSQKIEATSEKLSTEKDKIVDDAAKTAKQLKEEIAIAKTQTMQELEKSKDSVTAKVDEVAQEMTKAKEVAEQKLVDVMSQQVDEINKAKEATKEKGKDIAQAATQKIDEKTKIVENISSKATDDLQKAKYSATQQIDKVGKGKDSLHEDLTKLQQSVQNTSAKIKEELTITKKGVSADIARAKTETTKKIEEKLKDSVDKSKEETASKMSDLEDQLAKLTSSLEQLTEPVVTEVEKVKSYVTSPIMKRRSESQRISREERPIVREVKTGVADEHSDEEHYTVTEPEDHKKKKRKPLFHLESEEDDGVDASKLKDRRDSVRSNVLETLSENKLDNLLNDLEDQLVKDLEKSVTETKEITETKLSKAESDLEAIKKDSQADVEQIEQKLRDLDKALDSLEQASDPKLEKKLHRVERKFERMASEVMDKDVSGVSPTEVEARREHEFQRLVSQLSTEEVSDFQKEYSHLWDETTFSKSDDWDSKTPDSQVDVQELPQGEESSFAATGSQDSGIKAEGEESGATGSQDDRTSTQQRSIADQHQLSEEMKQLLKELEKESKQ